MLQQAGERTTGRKQLRDVGSERKGEGKERAKERKDRKGKENITSSYPPLTQICPFRSAFCIVPNVSPNGPNAFFVSHTCSPSSVFVGSRAPEGVLKIAALREVRKSRVSEGESKASWEVRRERGSCR
jgi:hypothetical protein